MLNVELSLHDNIKCTCIIAFMYCHFCLNDSEKEFPSFTISLKLLFLDLK